MTDTTDTPSTTSVKLPRVVTQARANDIIVSVLVAAIVALMVLFVSARAHAAGTGHDLYQQCTGAPIEKEYCEFYLTGVASALIEAGRITGKPLVCIPLPISDNSLRASLLAYGIHNAFASENGEGVHAVQALRVMYPW